MTMTTARAIVSRAHYLCLDVTRRAGTISSKITRNHSKSTRAESWNNRQSISPSVNDNLFSHSAAVNAHRYLSSSTSSQHYDIIIAGGGAVGSVLARLLLDDNFGPTGYDKNHQYRHRRRRKLRVALIEARSSPPSFNDLFRNNSNNNRNDNDNDNARAKAFTSTPPHPRAYALSPTSLSYLGPTILQSLIQQNTVGIYDSMQIWEHDGPAQLHFVGEDLTKAIRDGRLVNLHAMMKMSMVDASNQHHRRNHDTTATTTTATNSSEKTPWLGAVIEDAPLVASLWDELRLDDTRIDLLDNVQITSIRTPSLHEVGDVTPPPPVQLTFNRRRQQSQQSKNKHDNTDNLHNSHTTRHENNENEEIVNTITTNLLVAADGANSFVRESIGNFQMTTHSYGRKAVTCTVRLEKELKHTAYQRFLPHGPIALLPVRNASTTEGGNDDSCQYVYANVVWSTTPAEATRLLTLSSSEFLSDLNYYLRQGPNVNQSILPSSGMLSTSSHISFVSTILHEFDSLLRTANAAVTMGTWTESPSRNSFRLPPKSVELVSPLMTFDLSLSHVRDYTSPRVALVGDAAHTMHPMAGQGLNLGLEDVSSLAKLIKEAIDCGMDVGGTSLFLDRYHQERLMKGWGIVGGVHCLHELFVQHPTSSSSNDLHGFTSNVNYLSKDDSSIRALRDLMGYSRSLGMNIINGLPLVRQMLAEVAAGATSPFSKM